MPTRHWSASTKGLPTEDPKTLMDEYKEVAAEMLKDEDVMEFLLSATTAASVARALNPWACSRPRPRVA